MATAAATTTAANRADRDARLSGRAAGLAPDVGGPVGMGVLSRLAVLCDALSTRFGQAAGATPAAS